MRKIQLDVDALTVESFGTTEAGAKDEGTVRAASGIATQCGSCNNCSGIRPCQYSIDTNMQVACPCQDGTIYCVD